MWARPVTIGAFCWGSPNGAGLAPYVRVEEELRAAVSSGKLSRENTNVRPLPISLNQKRKLMVMCQDALAALEEAIQQEPVAGVTRKTPVLPR